MIKYIIYTQKNCEYCVKAKALLDEAGEVYEERVLDNLPKIKRFREAGTQDCATNISTYRWVYRTRRVYVSTRYRV